MPNSREWMVVMQTSEAPSVVGLALGTGMVDSCEVGVGRRHSGDLAPKLAELMAKNGVSIDDIGSVAVSRGPGGYTGLRVGLASALALTLIKDADLLAVPTLEAMAWQCPSEWDSVRMVADALRGRAFVQEFIRRDGAWEAAGPMELATWESIRGGLIDRKPMPWAGPGCHHATSLGIQVMATAPTQPSVEGLRLAALNRIRKGFVDNPGEVDILYGQPSSAEEQWKKLHPEGVV